MKSLLIGLSACFLVLLGCGEGGGSTMPTSNFGVLDNQQEQQIDKLCVAVGSVLSCVIEHQNLEREFTIYVPTTYNKDSETPLLFNFHGYGSNAEEHILYADFRDLAEEAAFILVVPQGSLLEGRAHWNSDVGINNKSTTDDLGFVSLMIQEIGNRYNIDSSQVYATGMSNGGAMSLYLACGLSHEITAVASVTGFMSKELRSNCEVSHPTSILLIHGTTDSVVSWEDGLGGGSILGIGEYWASYNNCENFLQTNLDDVNGDGDSGVIHEHSGCDENTLIQVYEMTGMDHIWPAKSRGDDLDAVKVVWEFLSGFRL